MAGNVEGRCAVISGASSGIGRAVALHLDRAGWQVFAGVRSDAAGDELRAASSGGLTPLTLDVVDPAAVAAAAVTVGQSTGGRLDALFNNAGVTTPGPTEMVPLDEIRQAFEVNVFGHLAMTQAFLPMLRQSRGRLVFTSSMSGRIAFPFLGTYAATKYALEAHGDALRRELRQFGIRVALVEPGSIDTGIWDKGLDPSVRARLAPESELLYRRGLDFAEKGGRRSAQAAIPVDAVVKAVDHALNSRRPKRRYVVGKDARIMIPIATHLPGVVDAVAARGIRRG
jgi:NAD(P)-dependent dehydrogenase (short-subunit alcohol dehydrogenase family)